MTAELLKIAGDSPLLIVDVSSAWTKFQKLPYKSDVQTVDQLFVSTTVQYATNGSDICLRRIHSTNSGGSDRIFCILPLTRYMTRAYQSIITSAEALVAPRYGATVPTVSLIH